TASWRTTPPSWSTASRTCRSCCVPRNPFPQATEWMPMTTEPVRLYDPDFHADPTESYRRMRAEHGPVVPVLMDGDLPAWLVIGYLELHHVLVTPTVFARDPRRWNAWDRVPEDWSMLPVVMPLPN